MILSCDFETTTQADDCRVWAWAFCEVGNIDFFECGNSIESFFERINSFKKPTLYFHNLRFDGSFIILYLFANDYKWVSSNKDMGKGTFTTCISDMGQFYSIEIESKTHITIYDSLKVLPFSVSKIAKDFNLPMLKGEIDYNAYREQGHSLTELEIAYIKNDVQIIALALAELFSRDLKKMTTASNALHYFKTLQGSNFRRVFPAPNNDEYIRQSYRGGFTFCNPVFQGQDIGAGMVLDVNSLYPSVMYFEQLPVGEGIYFEGKYVNDKAFPLYVAHFKINFEVKEKHIPSLQLKNNCMFAPTDYIKSSEGELIDIYMTNVDFELFCKQYEILEIEYVDGYKYTCSDKYFKDYIDFWMNEKITAGKEGNGAKRAIAKLMLNSLYGKFALNPKVKGKIPYEEDGVLHFKLGEEEEREPIYIPVGTFITAYARRKTISSAQKCYERFLYADTDSLHLIGSETPDGLEIDDYKLGAWKIESIFKRARFLRAKTYIEDEGEKLKVTCAGMPASVYKNVTWDNFHYLAEYDGKLKHTNVKGGVVLLPTPLTIKKK